MTTTNEVHETPELEAPPPSLVPSAEATEPAPPPAKVTVLKRKKKEEDEGEEKEKEEASGGFSKEMLALKSADHMAVKEWLSQISGQAAIKVEVHRREPKIIRDPNTGEDKKVNGLVSTYDRVVDEEELQTKHGGGTYQLIVKVRNQRGNWIYFNSRTIELAGDPRLDDVPRMFVKQQQVASAPAPDPVTTNLMGKAFDFMADAARGASRPSNSSSAQDITMAVQVAVAPLRATIDSLTSQLQARDREISAIREQASKGDPYKDKLLDKMLDTDNARVQALRMQHESEIRMLKEQAIANENRIRDQHQRDIERMERAHDRELASMKVSGDSERRALESAQNTQKMVLDAEVKRLEHEVRDLKTELIALRAKKEQTIKEKVEEMTGLQKLFKSDEDDEDDEKSTLTQVIEAAGNLPVVAALAERFGGGGGAAAPAQAAQPQVQMQPAQRRKLVRDKRSGAVLAPGPDGQLVPVQRVVPSADGNSQVAIPSVDPATVKIAIEYMTGAFQSGTSPEDFAESARPMIPPTVLGAIRALGIDEFMSKVAQLDGTSPLATQSGRNWRRRVANRLLGEADE